MNQRTAGFLEITVCMAMIFVAIGFAGGLLSFPKLSLYPEMYVEPYNSGVADTIEDQDRCDMRFPGKNITSINGVYSHPNYFCVWTEGRDPSDIAETTFHELAHYFAYNDPAHFNVEVKA